MFFTCRISLYYVGTFVFKITVTKLKLSCPYSASKQVLVLVRALINSPEV